MLMKRIEKQVAVTKWSCVSQVGGGFCDQRVTASTATKDSQPQWWHCTQNTGNSAERVGGVFCVCGKYQCRKRKEVHGRRLYFFLAYFCRRPGKTNKFQQCHWWMCWVVCHSAGGDYWLLPVKLLCVPERPGCAQFLHSQLYIQSINYSHW